MDFLHDSAYVLLAGFYLRRVLPGAGSHREAPHDNNGGRHDAALQLRHYRTDSL